MFLKQYKHEFSRGYSELIDVILDTATELNNIFYDYPAGVQWFLRKPCAEVCEELQDKDILISSVSIIFLYNPITGTYSFVMKVNVNASFMPEEVDSVCQEYFDNLVKFINKRFEVKDGIMITDETAHELALSIRKRLY